MASVFTESERGRQAKKSIEKSMEVQKASNTLENGYSSPPMPNDHHDGVGFMDVLREKLTHFGLGDADTALDKKRDSK